MQKILKLGMVGAGFVAKFHARALLQVRNVEIAGVLSRRADSAQAFSKTIQEQGLGEGRVYSDVAEMAKHVDAIAIYSPNFTRVEIVEQIVEAVRKGAALKGLICEKPLARNVKEARRILDLVNEAGLKTAYFENQIFMKPIRTQLQQLAPQQKTMGPLVLVRSAEEHGGPHMPWFWQGELGGGGVLNDMMCHSVEVARLLLTDPAKTRDSIKPVKVSATIASLKWSRPEYAELLRQMMGNEVDYRTKPSEDFARATINYVDDAGNPLIAEVTTSWSYVGAGLRLTSELLGPEYSLSINSLDTSLKLFLSRRVQGASGEDLVEKQNAEQGLMPVVASEATEYGYEAENRFFVNCFLDGKQPEVNCYDGLEVTQLLMTAYKSAEEERTIVFDPKAIENFVPAVARGVWKP